ncbi:MAG: sulfatase-like hydrolase/transferase [Rhodobacterales bacterium]|nr:sulfatase-like hydrolase/transferase [Rhodobacterales bacterium]
MRTLLPVMFVALVACPGEEDKVPGDSTATTTQTTTTVDCSTVTDTMPAFCGEVPKNLIFVSIDTTRKDHMSRYGDVDALPFLDAIADAGVALDNHTQCSDWTFASTTCTLAGRYNVDAGFIPQLNGAIEIPEDHKFLAGYLADAGYWSVLVSSNAWLSDRWGNGEGYSQIIYPGGGRIGGITTNAINAYKEAKAAGQVENGFFLHLHALEAHAPYNPPEEYLAGLADLEPIPYDLTTQGTQYEANALWPTMTVEEQDLLEAHLRVRYQGDLMLMNDGFEIMWSMLSAEGLLDDTLVVFWTDHGEAFWEHGQQTHAYQLYGEENAAIAIFWSKNIVPQAWDGPTVGIDITPTFLKLRGLPVPSEMTGIPLGEAPEDRPQFSMVSARLGQLSSVLLDGWRLQLHWTAGPVLPNPGSDPLEPENLYTADHEKVAELWPLLQPYVEAGSQALPSKTLIIPPELQ